MNAHFGKAFLIFGLFTLTGCTQLGLENPFDGNTASVNEIYYSQFPDVPIPSDMHGKTSETMVTPASDGAGIGVETFEGRVEVSSLASAMNHNLGNAGWSLRGTVTGNKTMQVYEKDQRVVVLYITSGMVNSKMEVWMLTRQNGSALNVLGSLLGGTVVQQWEGNYSSQPLWQ